MTTQPVTRQYHSDTQLIRKNLDQKRSSILVVERGNPEPILTLEGYVNESNSGPSSLNRNRVRCSTFGHEEQVREYDIDDIQIYRSE
ncbi:hypothetical protein [Spirosoma pollinicola]|uniref:Uncharacterized protein n=1 Tax=Spirosoma pollinicola TaxID=2057025 RepID=A0A2K8Z7T1_9BACT|nr:hypothetical protein [Spirosoma pollinicola]AUD05904.1 hypothetical protein CWM47_31110 [Spirosoma pollinicola]